MEDWFHTALRDLGSFQLSALPSWNIPMSKAEGRKRDPHLLRRVLETVLWAFLLIAHWPGFLSQDDLPAKKFRKFILYTTSPVPF